MFKVFFNSLIGMNTNTAVKFYIKRFINCIFDTIILLVIAMIVFYTLLQVFKIMWGLYQLTTVGKFYVQINPDISYLINEVLCEDLFHLSRYYVVTTFLHA